MADRERRSDEHPEADAPGALQARADQHDERDPG